MPLLSRGIILLPDDFMHLHGLSADSFYRRAKPEAMKSLAKDISLVRLRLFCWFCWVVVDELEVKVRFHEWMLIVCSFFLFLNHISLYPPPFFTDRSTVINLSSLFFHSYNPLHLSPL